MALLVLSVGLVAFAILWQASGQRPVAEQALARGQLGSGRVLRAVTQLGQMGVTIDPRVFSGNPRSVAGLLSYSRTVGDKRDAVFPSTQFVADVLGDVPAHDLLSVALDPRDWRGDHGLFDNSHKRGKNWERGACVSLFSGGKLVTESTVGLRIHGGMSRRAGEKSLRIYLAEEFGSSVVCGDLLPGAVGNSLVVHNDQRRMKFCNPISYELMGMLGCDIPRTRPMRVMVNGEMMRRTYFLSEHLSDSYVETKLGHKHFVRIDEQGGHHAQYDRTFALLKYGGPSLDDVARVLDVEDLMAWLTGVLFCAPYDCRQGVAYYNSRDQRWRWVIWDLDWSFGPWPERVDGSRIEDRSITAYLRHPWGDIRTLLFDRRMPIAGEFRARLLARISRSLNHEVTPEWCDALIEKYRGIARSYSPGSRGAEQNLDAIAAFMKARPKLLREELNEEFAVGPVYSCTVRVPKSASVTIDGHEYRADWLGHYFAGQEVTVAAGPGYGVAVDGVAVAGQVWRGVIVANTVVEVIRR
ncbi:MAG: hypothetical protein ACI91B_001543 [Planctomycetota bacterium]|jgi:hypothetical protein